MRPSLLRWVVVIPFATVLVASHLNTSAQTVNNSASNSGIAAANSQTDFSYSIDPMSVKNFSDDELNQTFDKMSSQYSKNAVLFNNIGATYFQRKMYDKAELAIRHAIILSNHPAFLTNLSIIYDTEEKIPDAISYAQRAVAQSPRYVRARRELCQLLIYSKRNADTITCYDELAKLAPLDDLDQTYYAVVSVRTGSYDKAISILTPLVHGPLPTATMFNALGYAYYMKKRYPQAADAFKQGVEIEPDSSSLRYNLAIVLTAVNDRAGALSQYNLMKTKSPDMAEQLYRALNRDKIIYVNDAAASKK
jgi:tetratricopeptide (TPR) repeat protein